MVHPSNHTVDIETIETSVKANFVEVNKKAFLHGVEEGSKYNR